MSLQLYGIPNRHMEIRDAAVDFMRRNPERIINICFMVSWLSCFLCFTSSVSLTGSRSYTKDEPKLFCCREKVDKSLGQWYCILVLLEFKSCIALKPIGISPAGLFLEVQLLVCTFK